MIDALIIFTCQVDYEQALKKTGARDLLKKTVAGASLQKTADMEPSPEELVALFG